MEKFLFCFSGMSFVEHVEHVAGAFVLALADGILWAFGNVVVIDLVLKEAAVI